MHQRACACREGRAAKAFRSLARPTHSQEKTMRHYTKMSIAAAALLSGLAMSESAFAYDVQCPATMTVTWNQAALGRTETFQNVLAPLVGPGSGPPVTELTCITSGFLPATFQQTVQLEPGSVVPACGAQATL